MNVNKLAEELKKITPFPNILREIFESLKDLLPMAAVELLIIHPDGSFVLIEKMGQFNGWALPSGYIGFNESLEDACRRIAKKDLDINLKSTEFVDVFNWPEGSARQAKGHAISILFRCKAARDVKNGEYFKKVPEGILAHHKIMLEAYFKKNINSDEIREYFSKYPEQAFALAKLETLIFNSTPKRCELLYLFKQTPDNDQSVINIGAMISKQNGPDVSVETKIGICGLYHPACSKPEEIKNKLIDKGARRKDIIVINYDHPDVGVARKFRFFNTKIESEAIVDYCLRNGIARLGICSPPLHQIRSYLAILSALKKAGSKNKIAVYNIVGEPLDWKEKAVHSQGTTIDLRCNLIDGEILRIFKYWQAGDLISPEDAVEYFLGHCK